MTAVFGPMQTVALGQGDAARYRRIGAASARAAHNRRACATSSAMPSRGAERSG